MSFEKLVSIYNVVRYCYKIIVFLIVKVICFGCVYFRFVLLFGEIFMMFCF